MPASTPEPSFRPPPRPPRRYRAGDEIAGKYRLESRLGQGGMGEVWRATNIALDASCAIKLIRAEMQEKSARDRLIQEARAAARLGHPAIVRVFDVGETQRGDPFIVMELLEGESLGAVLERSGQLRPTLSVQTLLPIADGLSIAHKRGIVHRDLKPDNVFMAESGERRLQPKLVDFGVVKLEQTAEQSKLTNAGMVVGSPAYMSPEQARGMEDVDGRSDIWAFCVMLFEALSGRLPFEANNYNALLRAIVEEDAPQVTQYADVDPRLAAIIDSGLVKDRDQRWLTMDDLGCALAEWLLDHGIHSDITGRDLETRWIRAESEPGRPTLDSLALDSPSFTPPSFRRHGSSGSGRRPVISEQPTVPESDAVSERPSGPRVVESTMPSSLEGATLPSPEPAPSRKPVVLATLAAVALGAGALVLVSSLFERPVTNAAPSQLSMPEQRAASAQSGESEAIPPEDDGANRALGPPNGELSPDAPKTDPGSETNEGVGDDKPTEKPVEVAPVEASEPDPAVSAPKRAPKRAAKPVRRAPKPKPAPKAEEPKPAPAAPDLDLKSPY